MKKLTLLLVILLPLLVKAQAHLSATLSDIKALHPENYFKIEYTKDRIKYATTQMPLGLFAYYFDSETGLSYLCIQIPNNLTDLNTQVEIYNKKYVITSNTSWRAYLEAGGMIYIKLSYDQENKLYSFTYTSTQ